MIFKNKKKLGFEAINPKRIAQKAGQSTRNVLDDVFIKRKVIRIIQHNGEAKNTTEAKQSLFAFFLAFLSSLFRKLMAWVQHKADKIIRLVRKEPALKILHPKEYPKG